MGGGGWVCGYLVTVCLVTNCCDCVLVHYTSTVTSPTQPQITVSHIASWHHPSWPHLSYSYLYRTRHISLSMVGRHVTCLVFISYNAHDSYIAPGVFRTHRSTPLYRPPTHRNLHTPNQSIWQKKYSDISAQPANVYSPQRTAFSITSVAAPINFCGLLWRSRLNITWLLVE